MVHDYAPITREVHIQLCAVRAERNHLLKCRKLILDAKALTATVGNQLQVSRSFQSHRADYACTHGVIKLRDATMATNERYDPDRRMPSAARRVAYERSACFNNDAICANLAAFLSGLTPRMCANNE